MLLRPERLIAALLATLALEALMPDQAPAKVDFSYAFATPHRITAGLPDDVNRTLLDCQPGYLRMSWSYDDLRGYPLGSFKAPPTQWDMHLTPTVDGQGFAETAWTRLDGWLPALLNTFRSPGIEARLEVIGGQTAALVRVRASNSGETTRRFVLNVQSMSWGENPAWVWPGEATGDNLVAGWLDRADRVLVMGVGAEAWSEQTSGAPPSAKHLLMVWDLAPGETREGYLVRPYHACSADLPALRKRDWSEEFRAGQKVWEDLLGRTAPLQIPDQDVATAWKACLADLFIMREPVAQGYIAGLPGTECYRASNAIEAGISAVAIDQAGLPREAANGYRGNWETQELDGNWHDLRGWGHLFWSTSGFRSWVAMEHYRLTGDRRFLARIFPRMLASSRWQEQQRRRTRIAQGQEKPVTYGLMPRGQGDCGLANDGDYYGVYLPHNIWAVYADKLSLEAATILGQTDEAEELRAIYETARDDLLVALDRGAIAENGYRWIPGVANKTCGSRWGALNALTPTGLLPPNHELVEGTLRKVESLMSPGGIPMNTGWLADGMWVAITLDNVAAAHMARGEGDIPAKYLYATLNHGTPLFTWCEERGPEPGSSHCTGDRQHLWTPVAVVRHIRDTLVREEGTELRLALATPREWLGSGEPVGVSNAPTHFGPVSYTMRYDAATHTVSGEVTFPRRSPAEAVTLYLRLPDGLKVKALEEACGAELLPGGEALRWTRPRSTVKFRVTVG